MTDEPDLTESQKRVLIAMAKAYEEGAPHLTDEDLAQQLGMSEDELQREIQGLVDLGFIGSAVMNPDTGDVRPMPPCRRCGKSADGLDHLCTRCRAIVACDQLCDNLTNALENFLYARWAPHEYGHPRPTYYVNRPNFDGDPAPYMQQITTAHGQIAAAASRLVKLAIPRGCGRRQKPPTGRSGGGLTITPSSSTASMPPSTGGTPRRRAPSPLTAGE
jgi:AraC-like DNA-binding protein